jgi:hypothetical protein
MNNTLSRVVLSTFRDAYRRRRCILAVDGFLEWKAIFGGVVGSPYVFGVVRVAMLTLLTLTALSACRSCGVVTAKFSGHAVTLRRSPTVFADTPMSGLLNERFFLQINTGHVSVFTSLKC